MDYLVGVPPPCAGRRIFAFRARSIASKKDRMWPGSSNHACGGRSSPLRGCSRRRSSENSSLGDAGCLRRIAFPRLHCYRDLRSANSSTNQAATVCSVAQLDGRNSGLAAKQHMPLTPTALSYPRRRLPLMAKEMLQRNSTHAPERRFPTLTKEFSTMASNQSGDSKQSGGSDPQRTSDANKKGGQQSQGTSHTGTQQQSGGTQRGGSGNFADDPQRASDMGRKGGEHSHGGSNK